MGGECNEEDDNTSLAELSRIGNYAAEIAYNSRGQNEDIADWEDACKEILSQLGQLPYTRKEGS